MFIYSLTYLLPVRNLDRKILKHALPHTIKHRNTRGYPLSPSGPGVSGWMDSAIEYAPGPTATVRRRRRRRRRKPSSAPEEDDPDSRSAAAVAVVALRLVLRRVGSVLQAQGECVWWGPVPALGFTRLSSRGLPSAGRLHKPLSLPSVGRACFYLAD